VTFIADFMNTVFDILVAPFGNSAAWAMMVISLLSGIVLLLLFKASTNQVKLAEAKRKLLGHLYEMGLYQESLRVLLRIQLQLAKANLKYLSRALPALIVMTIPVVLILAQLNSRFAYRPFLPEEAALLTVTVSSEGPSLLDNLSLLTPAAVSVESLPVRDYQARTITWRIRVLAEGRHELKVVSSKNQQWDKLLVAGSHRAGMPLTRLANDRERAGWHHTILNPGEMPLAKDSPVTNIALQLPSRETRYAGVRLGWIWAFCIFSLLFGFLLKDFFKVKI
jgi:hypothetical protein